MGSKHKRKHEDQPAAADGEPDSHKKPRKSNQSPDANPGSTVFSTIPQMKDAKQHIESQQYPPPLPPLAPELENSPFLHASKADDRQGQLNYERLEFLGDAYLEVIATRLIWNLYPDLPVGRQSVLREKLVRNSTLAEFAIAYGFDKRLQAGQERRFEHAREKILGDVIEAYLGALVLSEGHGVGGFDAAERWMTALWQPTLQSLKTDLAAVKITNRKDELAKLVGGKFVKLEYVDEAPMRMSADHASQQFTVAVYMTGWGAERQRLGLGRGISRREAGMQAAADALDGNRAVVLALAERKRRADEERRAAIERGEWRGEANGEANGAHGEAHGKAYAKANGKA